MIRDGQEYILKIRNHSPTVREYQQRVGFVQTDPNRFVPELHIPGSRNRQPALGNVFGPGIPGPTLGRRKHNSVIGTVKPLRAAKSSETDTNSQQSDCSFSEQAAG